MTTYQTAEQLAAEMQRYGVVTMNRWATDGAAMLRSQEIELCRLRAANLNMTQAIMDAYGILWNINTEPMAPIPMIDPERAAAKARLILKEMLCHEQCGVAINAARAALEVPHAADK